MVYKNGNENLKNESRLSTLEANYNNLQKDIDKILNNHLPHIQAEVTNTNNRLDDIEGKLSNIPWVVGGATVLVALLNYLLVKL